MSAIRRRPILSVPVRVRTLAVALTLAMFASACGDDPAGEEESEATSFLAATIGPDGGELAGEEGGPYDGVRVVVPPGALYDEVELRVAGDIDPTPLAATAERVGPQYVIEPVGTEFAVPIEVTVPFDPTLRNAWDIPDDECRVWYREGDGWARAEQTASTAGGVTVELSTATTFAAGVLTRTLSRECTVGCTAPRDAECRDGDQFCLERVGVQEAASFGNYYSLEEGVLYWLHAPRKRRLQLAGFDVRTGDESFSGELRDFSSGVAALGDVVEDAGGALWLTLTGVGNVKFDGTRTPVRFDVGRGETPLGVVYDQETGDAVRLVAESTFDFASGAGVTSVLGLYESGRVTYQAELTGRSAREIIQEGAESTERKRFFHVGTDRFFHHTFSRPPTDPPLQLQRRCGDGEIDLLQDVFVSQTGQGAAWICTSDTDGRTWLTAEGPHQEDRLLDGGKRGRAVFDSRGRIWLALLDEPVVMRFDLEREGSGIATIPLTDADSGSSEFDAMTPRSLHYMPETDQLVVVTRGSRGFPEIWTVTGLE